LAVVHTVSESAITGRITGNEYDRIQLGQGQGLSNRNHYTAQRNVTDRRQQAYMTVIIRLASSLSTSVGKVIFSLLS
jgi:hypothetical protein